MLHWNNISHQTKLLIVFFLLSCIPATLIGTIAYQKSSDMLHNQTKQDLDVILTQFNTSIERQVNDFDRFSMLPYFMQEIFSFLNKPYTSKEQWGSAEINSQKTLVRLMSAYPSMNSSIHGLMVYGMNGTINGYRVSGESAINSDDNVNDESWYKEVLAQDGGFVITGVKEIRQFTDSSFKAIVGARLLLDDNHRPLAVIAIYISPDFIEKIVRSLQLRNVQVTVLDAEQHLIYASDVLLAERLQSLESTNNKGEWVTELITNNNKKTYSGMYLHSAYLGWKIYLGKDSDEMLQGSRSIRNFTIATIIVFGVVAAAVSWLLARGLSKPIFRLIRSMREVEKGKFAVSVLLEREDEIGQLERSYGRMVHRLDEMIQSIEEKESQKRHAELYALRARIQPHFLYNTLNSIRMLAILQQSSQIAKLIQSLNKLLHANMKLDTELVTLEDEIRLLREYVNLMDLRYTNVFEIEYLIPNELHDAIYPPMLLQPLLENSIFHGAKGLERKMNIRVSARLENGGRTLITEIRDDGSGISENALGLLKDLGSASPQSNIGLLNVRDRIRLRFGEEYGLTAERMNDQGTLIILKMPYRTARQEGNGHVESFGS
jgi:two-component system sensor histidine kinase YesM